MHQKKRVHQDPQGAGRAGPACPPTPVSLRSSSPISDRLLAINHEHPCRLHRAGS